MTERDRYELKIAGLLHDCGKVTTPVHVVDKATKLQTIFDRIELIDTRFEVVKRDAEIALLKAQLAALQRDQANGELKRELAARLQEIDDDREFLRRGNIGGEGDEGRGHRAREGDLGASTAGATPRARRRRFSPTTSSRTSRSAPAR